MKNIMTNISFIGLIFMISCSNSNYNLLSSLSTDSLYISKNIDWQSPSNEMKEMYYGETSITEYATTELLKVDKKQIIIIKTGVMKTSDDSIHLFWPPDDGGAISIGRILHNSLIESKTNSLNKKRIKISDKGFVELNDKIFERIVKTDINWFREVMDKYSYSKSTDSLTIILSGP